jgi:hypothetical protein
VQWIDKRLQRFKNNLPDADFIAICQKVARHQATKKFGKVPSFQEWSTKTTGGKSD